MSAPQLGPDIGADGEIWIEEQQQTETPPEVSAPCETDFPYTLTDKLRMAFHNHLLRCDAIPSADTDRALGLIDKLIEMAGTVELLLNCAAEFENDKVCCTEYFQAADDRMDEIKKAVTPC